MTPQPQDRGSAATPFLCEAHGVLVYEGSCPDCRCSPVRTRTQLRWKVGDFIGRWISNRLGEWIEGETW